MTIRRWHDAVLLVLRHLEDRVDRLLLGRVDERARVHDEHVGVGGVLRELVPRLLRKPEHDLGVHEVLGTAERNHSNLHSVLKPAGFRLQALGLQTCRPGPELEALPESPKPDARSLAYGYSRYSIRGYGIVSRTCSSLQIQATTRSMPMPKPPCGTLP